MVTVRRSNLSTLQPPDPNDPDVPKKKDFSLDTLRFTSEAKHSLAMFVGVGSTQCHSAHRYLCSTTMAFRPEVF